MSKIAQVVYGMQSGIVRRIVVADSIEDLGRGRHVGEGEDSVIVNPDEVAKFDPAKKRVVPSLDECYALVEAKRGKPAESDRCVVLDDKGEIEAVVLADPYIAADRAAKPGKTLFQHPDADIGWSTDEKGDFVAPAVLEVVADRIDTVARG